MDPKLWREIERVFDEVAGLPQQAREERLALVPDAVRDEVRQLLIADEEAAGLIRGAVMEVGEEVELDDLHSGPSHFGPWRVTGILGQGGMGAVYRAIRNDRAFEKEVAIKVLRLGEMDDTSRARFAQERRILALLEHPNIARLIDGGEDSSGNAYIVMECVDGTTILDHAREAQLGTEDRLRLFCTVCGAVQYAHRNLVVHRDLKPANILVDKSGAPKLLDFGIAKLVDSDSLKTMTGFQALTPQYASPEQVRGEPITTASDVYSLGVVLFEMLTGRRPYDFPTLSPGDIDRVVCTVPPAASGLPADLDVILSMALRKEAARRYASVEQFAADCANYLERRPVAARPDTFWYRTQKYVRRNWLPVGAAAAVLMALATGALVAMEQARVAQSRFEEVRQLAHAFIFDFHDEAAGLAGSTKLREKMVKTALVYLDSLAKSAGNDRDLVKELAAGYQRVGEVQGQPSSASLGRPAEAVASFARAATFHERAAAMDPAYSPVLAQFYNIQATILRQTGDYPGAAAAIARAQGNFEKALRDKPGDVSLKTTYALSWCIAGDIEEDRSRSREAWTKNRKCTDMAHELLATGRTVQTLTIAERAAARLGTSSYAIGHLDEARAALDEDEIVTGELIRLEPNDPRHRRSAMLLAQSRTNLYCNDDAPSYDEPVPCLKYAQEYAEKARKLSEADPGNASARTSLAIALGRLGWVEHLSDPHAGVRHGRESIRIFDEQISGGNHGFFLASRRARSLRRLAEELMADGKAGEAAPIAREALASQREFAARDANNFLESLFLARALGVSGQAEAATGNSRLAVDLLVEAERVAASVWSRNAGDLGTLKQLSDARVALAAWFGLHGDIGRSRDWKEQAERLWREFPEQNEYVRRKKN